MQFLSSYLSVLLLCQAAWGFYLGNLLGSEKQFNKKIDDIAHSESSTSFRAPGEHSEHAIDISGSTSQYRSEQGNSESSLINGSSSAKDQSDANSSHSQYSTAEVKSESVKNNSSVQMIEVSTEIFNNDSFSNHSDENSSTDSTTSAKTQSGSKSTLIVVTPSSEINGSSSSLEPSNETEGVVLVGNGKPFVPANNITETGAKTLYQRTLELITDTYTLSIVVPIAAGVIFAMTIIVTIGTCRCLRRRCRRRQIRRKALPDSVKNLRPSDRARLLAESSDEEF